MRSSSRRAVLLLAAVVLMTPTAAGASPPARVDAHRSPAEMPVPGDRAVHLVVSLRSRNPALVAALGQARGMTRPARRSALAGATPTTAGRRRVAAALRRLGFSVVRTHPWLLEVTGTAAAAERAFGTSLVQDSRGMRPVSAVHVPAALAADVDAVVGLDTRAKWRSHAGVPDGLAPTDLRSVYNLRSSWTGAGRVVGTIQFSGWPRGDLNIYAAAIGESTVIPGPRYVATTLHPCTPGQTPYDPTDDDQCASEVKSDGDGGDAEVALDQEALLAVAPQAQQRPIFAPNSDAGSLLAYQAAVDLAQSPGGLDALSVSWGACEADMVDSDDGGFTTRDALDAKLNLLALAGTTVFAASGDAGRYDCAYAGDTQQSDFTTLAVDYPAAHPTVVGVGGTYLFRGDTGGWTEDAWSSPETAAGGYRGDGSGGGISSRFTPPSYQTLAANQIPAQPRRQVPDIAAVADPYGEAAGVYITREHGWTFAGGTSYAAPLMAGALAATESAIGQRQLGPIHAMLYDIANRPAFHDITTGGGTDPTDPTFPATVGYDRVTGLGTPDWNMLAQALQAQPGLGAPPTTSAAMIDIRHTIPAGKTYDSSVGYALGEGVTCGSPASAAAIPSSYTITGANRLVNLSLAVHFTDASCGVASVPVLYDTVAPTVGLAFHPTSRLDFLNPYWGFLDPSPSSGLDTFLVDIYKYGNSTAISSLVTRKRSNLFHGSQGAQYTVKVSGYDAAENVSSERSARLAVPWDDRYMSHSTGWGRRPNPIDFAGSTLVSQIKGSSATQRVSARYIDIVATLFANGGRVEVWIDGVYKSTRSLYSPTSKHQQLIRIANYAANGMHTVKLVVHGDHVAGSGDNWVILDGIKATH